MRDKVNIVCSWINPRVAVATVTILLAVGVWFPQNILNDARADQKDHPERSEISNSFLESLSDEERAWLREHPVISVVQDPDWPPVEFVDETGKPSGIASEYLQLVENRLGIKFRRVHNLNWQESYERLKHWEIDMTTCVAETKQREQFWAFTKPYMNIPIVILTQMNVTYVGNIRELEGKKVAVVDGYVSNEWIQQDFPGISLVKVKNVQTGIELLQEGEVFALIDNMLVIGYYLTKLKLGGLKISGWTPYVNAQAMAVRKDWAILASILQKAIDSIPESDISKIYYKWVPLQYQHSFDYSLLWKALVLFGLVIGGLLVWNHRLSKEIVNRQRTELALRESEQRYRDLWQKAPVMMMSLDRQAQIQLVSDLFCETLGYEREEVIGRKPFEFQTQSSANYAKSFVFPEFLEKGFIKEAELQFVKKNGDIVDVLLNVTAEKNFEGSVMNSRSVFINVTERKRAEEALRESEELLRGFFENAASVVWFKDLKGKFIKVNSYMEQVLGLSRQQIVGHTGHDICSNEEASFYKNNDNQVITQGKPIHFEETATLADGLHTFLSVKFPLRQADGKIFGIGAICTDITDRKTAEMERQRLESAIEQSAEVVVITDIDGSILYVNPAFEKVTGYLRNEVIGKNTRILQSGEHDKKFYEKLWSTIESGEVWEGRFVNKTRDGLIYYEDATISPVRDPSGKIINYVAVKRDVSEHLEMAKKLQQAQKMEAVGTLAGGVAHDFNNILQVTLGYSDLMLSDNAFPENYRSDLGKIRDYAVRGADLVQRLMTFSRKTETNPRPLNLNNSISELRKMLERTIPKMIDIRLVLSEDIDKINADPTQIDQILMNLSVNSRDAMPEGGTLTFETSNVEIDARLGKIDFTLSPGRYVLLEVSDTGHGIDKVSLDHIFEPFFTTKGVGQGTGLGLAIVHSIVQHHGGHIVCESQETVGTIFRIYFPSIDSEEVSRESPQKPFPRGGSETILLVDDELPVRNLCSRILQKAGYTVIEARNGEEALTIYQRHRDELSLIVLDLIMPGMGGKQCLEKLLELNPSAKIIIASGYIMESKTAGALATMSKGFVTKPYDMEEMLKMVRKVLDA